ncbi:MAG: DUF523 domain-containing protein [Candidatus Zixiibacteriota bacterium]
MSSHRYLISACLIGIKCRYDGKARKDEKMMTLMDKGKGVAVCPETLGGLTVPRPKVEIINGEGEDVLLGKCNVKNAKGKDVSLEMIKGALRTLQIARKLKIRTAFFKDKSPSCGFGKIYREGKLVKGEGVAAAILRKKGIKVVPK